VNQTVVSEIISVLCAFQDYFSHSLIIHQVQSKKITTMKEVWIPGSN